MIQALYAVLQYMQSCCPESEKRLCWPQMMYIQQLQWIVEVLHTINIVHIIVESVYSLKGLSQGLEWKCTTKLNNFHSVFEWEMCYFCSFITLKCSLSTWYIFWCCLRLKCWCLLAKKRKICHCNMTEISFVFLSQKMGQEILWHTNLQKVQPGKHRGNEVFTAFIIWTGSS